MSNQATKQSTAVHHHSCGKALRERALGQAGSPDPVPVALVVEITRQIAEHCGHRLLKSRRLAMGWTVGQAVAAAHQLVEKENLTRVGLSERSWKDWEAGHLPSPDYQDLLCRLFSTSPVGLGFAHDYSPPEAAGSNPFSSAGPGDGTLSGRETARSGAGLRTFTEVEETKRRDAVKLAGLAMASPAAAAQVLQRAAAEAMEFTRQAEATSLGSGTLDHLDLAVTEFNHAYSLKPPAAVFDAVMDYRRKVDALLKGRFTHRQERELLAFAGWMSELLAWLAHGLGDARTGLAFAHAQLGAPDDAVALGHRALDSARVVGSVLGRAGDLTLFLTRRYPRQAAVEGLCERLSTAALARPALPAASTTT
ncbi:hypothetical protein [Streptomyces marincola]|uniref:hypothetical protein n=1 Tax=Streptomyces marincola TaxID=2878388 RepID=UPI0021001573|nr:hypothetical protein [Streptomyces marincola]